MVDAPLHTPDNNNEPATEREWMLFIVLAGLLGGGAAVFLIGYLLFL